MSRAPPSSPHTYPLFPDPQLFRSRPAGHPALPAPPTYVCSLALGAPPSRGNILGDMGVDMRRILHGEQSFTYHRPIHAGDTITLTTTTSDIYEKKGGALEFKIGRASCRERVCQYV